MDRVMEADAGFVQAAIRAHERIAMQQAHTTFRAVRAAIGSDPEFEQVLEAAVIGETEAERLAFFRKAGDKAATMAAKMQE